MPDSMTPVTPETEPTPQPPEETLPNLDSEWYARHGSRQRRAPSPSRRRRWLQLVLIIVLIAGNLGIGLFGGLTGFIALSNSNAQWARTLRSHLGLGSGSSLTVPINQSYQFSESSAIIDAAKKVSPAVVSITASAQVANVLGQVSQQEVSGGSGFIITSDGLIITNKHVVEEQGVTYKVLLNDGRILDATIQATDPYNDLAVVKVNATNLPTVELGSSDSLQIGQLVLADGNALGQFNNSVSLGIVSAKGRELSGVSSDTNSSTDGEQLSDLIQTDAAINQGNSGGPLVNMAGQVVGINTAIASTTGGSVGIGFAIAIDSIKNVIDSVRKTGQIIRPYMGVRYWSVTKTLQTQYSLPVDYGALVTHGTDTTSAAVVAGSPADKAGIKEGDILVEINGDRIDDTNSLQKLMQRYNVGDTIQVKFLRSGKEQTVSVKLEQLPNS